MNLNTRLPALGLNPGEIHQRVITCGDPARAEMISKLLENPVCMAKNREYWTYNGLHKGTPVTVTSHGVGCGGAVILFESLWRAGAKAVIRVGTCGGMQEGIDAGSIVVATAACREEGVTDKIIPGSYPAVADMEVTSRLLEAAERHQVNVHRGIVLTQALFYPGYLESKVKLYAKAGVVAMENEAASLFVVSSLHGMKAGAILAADAKAFELVGVENYQPSTSLVKEAVENEIKIALDAIIATSVK